MVTTRSLPAAVAGLASKDLAALERAWRALEQPSFAARASSIIGAPIEQILRLFPRSWHDRVHEVAQTAIARAYDAAVASLEPAPAPGRVDPHRALAVTTGAIGGFFGLPALLVELPATTILMLRAIVDTARRHGEPLEVSETRLACLEVFALGGRGTGDDYAEIGYYEVRIGLAVHFASATVLSLGQLKSRAAVPAPVGLIRAIASRFGIVVSDKAAAQMVPVLGAIAGGLVNAAFMDHFQTVANGHFTVRRLEREYGRALVESAYHAIGEMIEVRDPLRRTAGRRRSRRAGSEHPG